MKLWDAFIEDYGDELHDCSLRKALQLFYHFCKGGPGEVHRFINHENNEGEEREAEIGIKHRTDEPVHTENPDCWCGPDVENYEDGILIVHKDKKERN